MPEPTKTPTKNFDTTFDEFMILCKRCGSENVSLHILGGITGPSIQAECINCDTKDYALVG